MKIPRKLEPILTWTERIDDATIAACAQFKKVERDKVYAFSTFVILDRDQMRGRWNRSWHHECAERHFHERLKERVAQYGYYLPYVGDGEHFA